MNGEHSEVRTPVDTPFASWAMTLNAAKDFMWGYENWIVIRTATNDLDVFCNLVLFHRIAKPFTAMHGQKEVIVRMPSMMQIGRRDIVWSDFTLEAIVTHA